MEDKRGLKLERFSQLFFIFETKSEDAQFGVQVTFPDLDHIEMRKKQGSNPISVNLNLAELLERES